MLTSIEAFECDKCGYKWISHKYTHKNPPVACAKCKSPYWNRGNHRFTMAEGKILPTE
jgi:predicted Zn-ribbon and HTH transcriptional regulator